MIKLKKYLIFLFIFSFNLNYAMYEDNITTRIKNETAKILISKHPLDLVGFGGGAVYGIRALSLSFEVRKNVSINEARKLVLACAETFLEKINEDKEIRPYLEEYPFPVSRIKLRFFVRLPPPFVGKSHLSTFGISYIERKNQSMLDYNVDEGMRLKEIFRETYEEAQKRVKENE